MFKFQHKITHVIILFFFAAGFTLFTGCEKVEELPSLNIRVVNLTQQSLGELLVFSLNGENHFGTVNAGVNTNYKNVGAAYSIPACEFEVNGVPYKIMIRCANPSTGKITTGNYSLVFEKKYGNEFDVIMRKD